MVFGPIISVIEFAWSPVEFELLLTSQLEMSPFQMSSTVGLTTCLRVFPTRRPDTADVLATSCDVGFFFSVSYVVSLPNCRHVVVVTTTTYHTHPVSVKFCDQETGTNLHTQERNKRFSTLQLLNAISSFSFLSCSLWRHLSCSPFFRSLQRDIDEYTVDKLNKSKLSGP